MKPRFDKKLIFLFIIMILMVSFMVYFLQKNVSKNIISEDDVLDSKDYGRIIDIKRAKINNLLEEVESMFDEDFQNFINSLDSYLSLPIEINKDDIGNKYPFGNPIDDQDLENLDTGQ